MRKYDQAEIEIFKAKLLEIKYSEEKEFKNFDDNLTEIFESGKDENSIDTTSYSVQVETLINAKNRIAKHLTQVNNALLRIQNNNYGICAETGHLIPKERLLAVPTTTLSMEGKLIREKKIK